MKLADKYQDDLWGRKARRFARVERAADRAPLPQGGWAPALWRCSCGRVNHKCKRVCMACKARRV